MLDGIQFSISLEIFLNPAASCVYEYHLRKVSNLGEGFLKLKPIGPLATVPKEAWLVADLFTGIGAASLSVTGEMSKSIEETAKSC